MHVAKKTTQIEEGDVRLQQRAARRMLQTPSRLEVRNAADEPKRGELVLEGPIWRSDWAFEGEISPANVRKAIEEMGDVDRIDIYLSSPGGDPWAAQAIHALLKRQKAEVVAHLDGLVASAATIVALGADRVVAHSYSTFMIHAASALLIGWFNAEELRDTAGTMDQLDRSIAAVYQSKTGGEIAEIKAMMDAESWFVGSEIVEAGFADDLDDADLEVAASIDGDTLRIGDREFDLSCYQNRPAIGRTYDDVKPEPVHTDGLKEVTANQFRDALAEALGFKIKDNPDVDEDVTQEPPAQSAEPAINEAPRRGRSFYAHQVALNRNRQKAKELNVK